ncbi:hypothetical protein VTK56DRAFT_4365 [Thermocarpiscus australiensis]
MSSVPRIQTALSAGGSAKPKAKRPNPVRRIMDREQRIRESSVASTASTGTPAPAAASSRLRCKNPHCTKSDIRDGACQTCGRVADGDHNIVAEVQFGETASGAAVVHGSYLAADQGSIRPTGGGLAFRRVAGAGATEARERSLREAKQLMTQFAYQLQIPPHVAEAGFRLYKVASNSNFIQGRRKNTVAAVCLYAACRKEENNKVMLIDLADIIKTDVFLLGRSYKELLALLPDVKEGTKPVIIEDLIFRFATKLEFLHDTNKVALSAIRIAQRMRHDNITHGRRPAGICGAALIMAARAHNYRRTVREVVYIAKVTMATLQERMEEFANVPSAQMTIREFHEAKSLPETSHDPPFVYKQSKEWQEKHPKKARKRKAEAASPGGEESSDGTAQQNGAKRQKTASSEPQTAPAAAEQPAPSVDAAVVTSATLPSTPCAPEGPSAAPVVDKDGFVVPPTPQQPPRAPPSTHDRAILRAATAEVNDQLEALADEFGDPDPEESEESDESEEELDPSSEMAMAVAQGIHVPGMRKKIKKRERPIDGNEASDEAASDKAKKKKRLLIDEEWELDEANLEKEMQGHLNDPAMIGASAFVTRDIERRREQEDQAGRSPESTPADANENGGHIGLGTDSQLHGSVSDPRFTPMTINLDDPIVHEDEFKDDPEVMFCKLSERDVLIKEMIWANHNKDYMRKVQQKIFETKMSGNDPQKPKRTRPKKPRIGEGQATPASSADEATRNMLRTRAISTKLDYSRMGNLFQLSREGPGSAYGGASSVGSRSALPSSAGSDAGSDAEDDSRENGRSPTPATETATTAAASARPATAVAKAVVLPGEGQDDGAEDGFGNDDEYGGEDGYQEETYGEEDFDPFGDNNGGDDFDE